ncbi:hypothetical protein LOTGIDRAFT_239030 [Lottia gigantea]|uniref:CUB domain-containing protein n=1 Tax=Lottia gigantea TaxID=225164 RepID=V4A3S5_LOTGI|nr:hypothetical protein LOTGIDRAFT_239030 [Lottia gigantea]ESO98553.1 hypothetical protein LOTGIDRAFT_239030 [Lottia gigantea]
MTELQSNFTLQNRPTMEKLNFITVLEFLLGCLITGLSAKDNYTIVRLEATGALKDLISPNFPSNYPIYEKMLYILTAKDSHNGIAIKFAYFLMETSKNCEADSLKLYKANYEFKFLEKTYCGHKKPSNIFIPENNVTLVFTTNGHQEKRGFRLQYYAPRTNPFPKKNSKSKSKSNNDSNMDGIPIGIGIGFGICAFLTFVHICHKKQVVEGAKKMAEEKEKAEAKKKAETEVKKKAETEAKQKAETEAKKKAETEAKQKDEAKKKEETKQKAEETKKENKKPKCDESPNAETDSKAYQPVNQSTQTLIQPLHPVNQSAYGSSHPLIPIGQPTRTQPLPPINESLHSISQHFPPNALQSQAQPLFQPIEMLYPPIQSEQSHPIHLVQPVSNNPSFTRQLVGTEASDGTRNYGFTEVQPPSYEGLSFNYNIPETKLL